MKAAVVLADRVKDLGFEIAARAGISISMDNLVIPEKKQKILEKANKEVLEVAKQYAKGLITEGERYNKVVDIWAKATDAVTQRALQRAKRRGGRDSGWVAPIAAKPQSNLYHA